MPITRALHLNPPGQPKKTRCGRWLAEVRWTLDAADVTCNSCIRLHKGDK